MESGDLAKEKGGDIKREKMIIVAGKKEKYMERVPRSILGISDP